MFGSLWKVLAWLVGTAARNPRTRILLVRALPRAPSRAYHGVRTRYTAIKCIRTTAAYKTSGYI